MIKIEGVCEVKLSMKGFPDFVSVENLSLLKVQSEAGNVLPRMILFFKMSDPSIMSSLNEGNTVDVVMGTTVDAPDRLEGSFKIVIPKIKDNDVELYLVHDSMNYTNTPSIEVFTKSTSLDVLSTVLSRSYTLKKEIEAVEDEVMNWKKPFISDKKMVDLALTRSWIKDDTLLLAIKENGDALLTSVLTSLDKEYKVKFTQKPEESNDYVWDSKEVDDQRSMNNAVSGYGRSKRVFDVEQGTSKILMYKPSPTLATAAQLAATKDVKMAPAQSVQKNENTHSKWEEAEQKNRTEWDSLSSLKLKIVNHKTYIPVNVLDLAFFEEFDDKGEVIENYYGQYLVTLICRTICNKQFSTYVEMCRESTTSPVGDFNLLSILEMIKYFLKNLLNLSLASLLARIAKFLLDLIRDALDLLGLSGSYRYQAQAIDSIVNSGRGVKTIVDRGIGDLYDSLRGVVDSNSGLYKDAAGKGIKDFLDGLEDVDLSLNPDDFPPEMAGEIDDFNSQVPSREIIDTFGRDVVREVDRVLDDIDQSLGRLGDNPSYSDVQKEFGLDPLSGLGSPKDLLNKWVC